MPIKQAPDSRNKGKISHVFEMRPFLCVFQKLWAPCPLVFNLCSSLDEGRYKGLILLQFYVDFWCQPFGTGEEICMFDAPCMAPVLKLVFSVPIALAIKP